jgi:DNA polymerase III subunit epsilon
VFERFKSLWSGAPRSQAVSEHRWVVVDVETSGLDPSSADLLAIAAIALHLDWATKKMTIALGDSFEVEICPPRASEKANVLLHGIGQQRQLQGVAPATGLEQFSQFVGNSPLLAFHANFDKTILLRASKLGGVPGIANQWLDLAHLCRVVHQNASARSLDEWMDELGVVCADRHKAAADTLAEAQVMLLLWPHVLGKCSSFAQVQMLAEQRRWLGRE